MPSTTARYAGAAAQIALTWTNPNNAVGSGTGSYATYTSSAASTEPVIEVSSFGVQADVPAGSTIDSVVVTVRHFAASLWWTSERAQLYVGTTPVGTLVTLPLRTGATEDSFTVTGGLTWADLADLRVRYAPLKASYNISSSANLDRVAIVVNYTEPVAGGPYDMWPGRPDPGAAFGGAGYTLGQAFTVTEQAWCTGILFWAQPAAGAGLFARLWDGVTGDVLGVVAIPNLPSAGNEWREATLPVPVALTVDRTYVVGTPLPDGGPIGSTAIPGPNGPLTPGAARFGGLDGMPTGDVTGNHYGHSPIVVTDAPTIPIDTRRRLLLAT